MHSTFYIFIHYSYPTYFQIEQPVKSSKPNNVHPFPCLHAISPYSLNIIWIHCHHRSIKEATAYDFQGQPGQVSYDPKLNFSNNSQLIFWFSSPQKRHEQIYPIIFNQILRRGKSFLQVMYVSWKFLLLILRSLCVVVRKREVTVSSLQHIKMQKIEFINFQFFLILLRVSVLRNLNMQKRLKKIKNNRIRI